MKNIKLSVLAGLLLASSAAFGASIVGSPHDLTGTVYTDLGVADLNGEICVFCHTPHGASGTMTGAPLWNKADMADKTFVMYGNLDGSAGTAGTTVAGTSTDTAVANASLACLSCHDGVSSIDSVVNAPGSGFNTNAGALKIQDVKVLGARLNDVANIANLDGLTRSLSNTHPVSIVYDATADGTKAGSLKALNTVLVGWQGATDISSLLRNDRVECGSCHDPHNGTAGMDAALRATEVNFLRHSNAGSALCIGCHNK